ncbi:Microbial collagenase, secreted [Pseudoalteromonas luteoviolacea B = ATCC 29581]|nr:Microbial collagenase, secreted [Pseudoalteromonas luteoviolacea B = ATCC 29581]
MKLNRIIIALPILGLSAAVLAQETRSFAPIQSQQVNVAHHFHSEKIDERAPSKQRISEINQQHNDFHTFNVVINQATIQAAVACDLNAMASASSSAISSTVMTQGADCVNDLFSTSESNQAQVFTSNKMIAVARTAANRARNYQGNGDADLEALVLFLRAGFYAEFYNNTISFSSSVQNEVKLALDAFVANSHFYDNNDAHGAVLSEILIAMDSAELQHVYLEVVKGWLQRWDQNYAAKRNMQRAVNNIFTILFRGQWNSKFEVLVKNDQPLVELLSQFTLKSWMVDSDSEYLAVNAAGELARLTMYSGGSIQAKVDSALNSLFATYKSYGFGDGLWLNAADVASYYTDCKKYNICNFDKTLEAQVLSQIHDCSATIKIRAQELTALQLQSACTTMEAEETRFHARLATNNQPVADDNNTFLQVNIFNSSNDYGKYAKAIFKIDTNNGGMYLEGNPSQVGNQANFVAYEASYAKADHFIWNLEHEYVHYLDGRFDLYGDFNTPTEAVVWWSEGVAEYIANLNDNQRAIDTIKDGSVYTLSQIFATTYAGFDQDRIYRWGYLAVRFMFERHFAEVQKMLNKTRVGDWAGYKATIDSWSLAYGNEFTQWTQDLANGNSPINQAPTPQINGPYSGSLGEVIEFSSAGSYDSDGAITQYFWDFGDGAQSNQASPSHVYQSAGNYTVRLTVTDNKGLSSSVTTAVQITSTQTGQSLQKGVAKILSGNQDSMTRFTFDVPSGANDLRFVMAGGTGDADLYVKFGSEPTLTSYDCRPYIGGNSERCDMQIPRAGTYHVLVRGYNAFSNVSLTADYLGHTSTVPNACQTQAGVSGGRLQAGKATCLSTTSPIWLSLENVSATQSISIETAHGTGDLNLEYSNAGWPNGSNVEAYSMRAGNAECINLSNQSQYWGYLKVSGNSQGATILVKYNEGWCN